MAKTHTNKKLLQAGNCAADALSASGRTKDNMTLQKCDSTKMTLR